MGLFRLWDEGGCGVGELLSGAQLFISAESLTKVERLSSLQRLT